MTIYPGDRGTYDLYEDDGISYAYLDGQVATTEVTCRKTGQEIVLKIGARQGSYEGMPEERHCDVCVHLARKPASVTVNGKALVAGKAEAAAARFEMER